MSAARYSLPNKEHKEYPFTRIHYAVRERIEASFRDA